ncbi:hypothetical protein [Lapillicoccus jejuensis]|uniref:ABC-2 type transport system permease protein n=1 Tax=Lapillicoccus jejuensis TaxID=402171 RepID=A0A542E3W6_9MICO|nr:hypothetical protein [Lapillicoccus jejuensis]TQJ09989.1 hypothetical protein FB458_3107 [Lapillicoccus jejuensis]
MPTGTCSPERTDPPGSLASLGLVLRLRWRTVPTGGRVVVVVLLAVLGSAVGLLARLAHGLPDGAGGLTRADVVPALPATLVGFLLTTTLAAVAAGGGREALPADQVVAFPVGPRVDHLAALALAPVTVAWVAPAAALVVEVCYLAPHSVAPGLLVVALWLAVATATAQLVGWGAEAVRGAPYGVWVVRLALTLVVAAAAVALWTGRLAGATRALGGDLVADVVRAGAEGDGVPWVLGVLALLALTALAVALGDRAAAAVARRPRRVRAAAETRRHPPGRTLDAHGTLRRLDRAGVLRSPPLARGLLLLALLPGLVALAAPLDWVVLPVVPGFFGLGGALLFGVNAFVLDGGGAWWRESLPVAPRVLLRTRARLVAEVLALPTLASLVLGAVRAGWPPGPAPVVATAGALLVVAARILASTLRWSVRHPHAADLGSPRAQPAPAGTLLADTLRLTAHALAYGVLFCALAVAPWWWAALAAVVLLVPSVLSLRRTARLWDDPVVRAGVVRTVAGG